jgi:hypothetical protein
MQTHPHFSKHLICATFPIPSFSSSNVMHSNFPAFSLLSFQAYWPPSLPAEAYEAYDTAPPRRLHRQGHITYLKYYRF